MLQLDALMNAPTVWACLTTREVYVEPERFARTREAVIRALRRRWPSAEYVGFREWTTGYGARSGGHRREHLHLFVKNVPVDQAQEAFDVAARVWCLHVDAELDAQRGGAVNEATGLIRYVTAHHAKESQAPPRGFRGKREVRSQGYLEEPVDQLRARARESIYRRRVSYRLRREGLRGAELECEVALELGLRARRTWAYYEGSPDEESYFRYEADRIESKLGGWRAAPRMAAPWSAIASEVWSERGPPTESTLPLWGPS